MKLTALYFLLMILVIPFAYGATTHHQNHASANAESPKLGNLILPTSQQPGPLIGFGQNIIQKGQVQLFLMADRIQGQHQHFVDLVPSLLYGLTDNASLFFNLPIAASYEQNHHHAAGIEDAFLQYEYAFYNQDAANYNDQATIVTNITFPTGSSTKHPPTGFGAPSFFLGTTFNRMTAEWFAFTSYGATITTTHHQTKFGNQYLYQVGAGRNIFDIGSNWILAWMIEADGQYSAKNRIYGAIDPNSGGNVIAITPSLWLSSKQLILQLGIEFPVLQHLFGQQNNNDYIIVANLGWSI